MLSSEQNAEVCPDIHRDKLARDDDTCLRQAGKYCYRVQKISTAPALLLTYHNRRGLQVLWHRNAG